MYLLDTNVISELRKMATDHCNSEVANWAEGVDLGLSYLSVITILEIELGIRQIARRDAPQADTLRRWFNELLKLYEQRIIPLDTSVAIRTAALHVPDPKPERDAIIAATALVHGHSVVTRNITDFENTGVILINPWMSSIL